MADPTAAPIISCAIVPTTISDNAEEMRSQIESRVAIKARPSHRAARAQMPVIVRSNGSRRSTKCLAARHAAAAHSLNQGAENAGFFASDLAADLQTPDESAFLLPAWSRVAGVISPVQAVLGDPIPLRANLNVRFGRVNFAFGNRFRIYTFLLRLIAGMGRSSPYRRTRPQEPHHRRDAKRGRKLLKSLWPSAKLALRRRWRRFPRDRRGANPNRRRGAWPSPRRAASV